MENRFSRASSSRSATASDIDDALYPAYHHYRPGPSLAPSARRPAPSPSRDYAPPPPRPASPENIFADPTDSPPPSPTGSAFYSNSVVTPTPSVRRPSLSLSARRSPSPLPGGGSNNYYTHHRLSPSLSPSVRSSSSSTYGYGNGLIRSNTTGTNGTGYSTLSSIPSNLSDLTSPPSPLPPIAPVRPQWNYGGHQQNIYPDSISGAGSVVVPEEDDDNDPFADNFMILPVGDGFAPHHQRPPPALIFPSGASSVGSIEPPPYTRYPEQPKPEEGAPLRMLVSNGDSGIDVGGDGVESRRSSRRPLAPVGGVGLVGGAGGMMGAEGDGGGGGYPDDDRSGARKEWEDKRILGFRFRAFVVGVAVALVVLLAVGLGVGLGVGRHPSSAAAITSTVYPSATATNDLPPTPEQTGPPLSSPNDTFPAIPTGLALLSPLFLDEYASACEISAPDSSAPKWFDAMGSDLLWSCQSEKTMNIDALSWRFERFPKKLTNMEDFDSHPDFLRGAEYGDGSWGGYLVSSVEGIQTWEDKLQLVVPDGDGVPIEYPNKPFWRDGTQNQPFWRIPFAFYNNTDDQSGDMYKRDGGFPQSASSYKFGVLFNKTVIVKQSTIDANIAAGSGQIYTGNGTILMPGEIIWKCVWEKTLLEVEIQVDIPSQANLPHGNGTKKDDDIPTSTRDDHRGGYGGGGGGGGGGPGGGPGGPPTGFPDHHNGDDHSDDEFFGLTPDRSTPSSTINTANLDLGNASMSSRLRSLNQRRTTSAAVNSGGPIAPYPYRINMKESRPIHNRLRQVLGMDLTDPDPHGRATLGEIKCTQYTVTGQGGLRPLFDIETGEGTVLLKEPVKGAQKMKERRSEGSGRKGQEDEELMERNSDCFCRWNS